MRKMFSKEQLEKMISEKIALESVEAIKNKDVALGDVSAKNITCKDLDASGNISGKKITAEKLDVEKALHEFDIDFTNTGGRTATKRYMKGIVSGGFLYIIISAVFSNETESTIASSNVQLRLDNIPTSIGDKIICVDGVKVSDAESHVNQICSISFHKGSTFYFENNSYIYKNGQNNIAMNVNVSALEAGASEQVEGRVFISLF